MNSLTESPTDHHVPPAFPGSVTVISEAAPLIPPSHQHRTTGALPHHRSRSSLSFSDDPKTRRKEFAGLALMALSALAFSFMSLFVKIAYPDFQSFEIVLARSVVQLVLGLAACAVLGVSPLGTKGIRRWLIMRGLAGGVGLALFFYSLTKLPLADTTVLFFLGPTMTTLLAYFLYSEHFTPLDLLLTCFCALGVVFIAHPSSIFADTPNPEDSLAIYAALIGSLMSAVAYVTARKVGRATHFMVHVVYFGAVSSVLSAAGMYLWQGGIVVPVKMEQWIVLAASPPRPPRPLNHPSHDRCRLGLSPQHLDPGGSGSSAHDRGRSADHRLHDCDGPAQVDRAGFKHARGSAGDQEGKCARAGDSARCAATFERCGGIRVCWKERKVWEGKRGPAG
ncbi:hypothetical protein BC938DRAFT_482607 [Jimgerdemannia flammicorona]|uniref:EamA domain-containing protein n=1 Tax=Jimgerdemannia flammicorona TaxID=994334 RepID=A0A433QDJ3_9FUNG|nr:hypothetical protein BC938DRAFT_482607 [Jimgerdemannia flammicorona]